jgi:hypothetical protein
LQAARLDEDSAWKEFVSPMAMKSSEHFWYDRDVGTEIKVDGQRNKFVQSKEVVSLHKWYIIDYNDGVLLWPVK